MRAEEERADEAISREINESLNIKFDAKATRSTLASAIIILENTYSSQYFSRVNNLAFHDLTEGKVIPPSTADLLGYGFKFIPKPPKTTGHLDLQESLTRFRRDVYLRSFWAGPPAPDEDDRSIEKKKKSKLYMKSNWTPPSAPSQVDSTLFKFADEISHLFQAKSATPNLLRHETKILANLKDDEMIVIAQADKGLGPCAVSLEQYILDGLKHLGDKSTYTVLDEDTAKSLLILIDISDDITRW
eukprot:scaffold16757_cov168-Skeletonema_dohrnii-CCMP3373.AAC.2